MSIKEKFANLVQDQDNKLRFTLIKKGLNYFVLIEKLHSLYQWFGIFIEEFYEYDMSKIQDMEIDKAVIEIINLLSISNGVVDTFAGLNIIIEKIAGSKIDIGNVSFKKTRQSNKTHDDYFDIGSYNDLDYFKHIRAVFGQHPSNLSYGNGKRGFSSWPFVSNRIALNHFDSDYYVNVYFDLSLQGWGHKFHLYLNEIRNFVHNMIGSIDKMIDTIYDIVESYIVESCPGEIEGFHNLDISAKIKVLKDEIIKRYSFDDYHYLLHSVIEIENMSEFSKDNTLLVYDEEYEASIHTSLNEIHDVVSTCSNQDLNYYSIFYDSIMSTIGHHYYREKCSMYLLNDIRYSDIFGFVNRKIASKLKVGYSEKIGDFYFRLFVLFQRQMKVYDTD